MGQIIFDAACTLNGFLADEQHSLDWLFAVPGAEEPDDSLFPADAAVHVCGANTYLWVLKQENLLSQPARWQELYADKPTFVFSTRQLPIPQGADVRLVSGSVSTILPQIREAANEGDIWVLGGGELVGQFVDAQALDRLALTMAPATLSGGAAVLPRTLGAHQLKLVHAGIAGPFARLIYEVSFAH